MRLGEGGEVPAEQVVRHRLVAERRRAVTPGGGEDPGAGEPAGQRPRLGDAAAEAVRDQRDRLAVADDEDLGAGRGAAQR